MESSETIDDKDAGQPQLRLVKTIILRQCAKLDIFSLTVLTGWLVWANRAPTAENLEPRAVRL